MNYSSEPSMITFCEALRTTLLTLAPAAHFVVITCSDTVDIGTYSDTVDIKTCSDTGHWDLQWHDIKTCSDTGRWDLQWHNIKTCSDTVDTGTCSDTVDTGTCHHTMDIGTCNTNFLFFF